MRREDIKVCEEREDIKCVRREDIKVCEEREDIKVCEEGGH